MPRERTQPLDQGAQQLIRKAMAERKLINAELARLAGVDRSLLTRILRPNQPQQNISVRALRAIADILAIDLDSILEQFELELEITDEFIEAARVALTDELRHLQQNVGRVRASRMIGVVGVEIHGTPPEKRVFERVFALPTSRSRRQTASSSKS